MACTEPEVDLVNQVKSVEAQAILCWVPLSQHRHPDADLCSPFSLGSGHFSVELRRHSCAPE